MTNRDFILAPTSIDVRIELEPGHSMLNTLSLLMDIDNYTGMDEWLYQLNRHLSPEVILRNSVLMEIFSLQLLRQDVSWPDLNAVADFLQMQDAEELINAHLAQVQEWIASKPGASTPNIDDLRHEYDIFYAEITRLQAEKDIEANENVLRLSWEMLQTPQETRDLAVQHLRDMWQQVLKDEWTRRQPMLEETVAAFQKLDYTHKSALEVTRIITGRDLSDTPLAEKLRKLENAQRLVFVPNPHIGPYVGIIEGSQLTRVYFRPRMPEGVFNYSPAIDRSELLV
ncbi:MAG: hypothetical protein ACLFTK_14180, partial [Anaerolineales bacterium]